VQEAVINGVASGWDLKMDFGAGPAGKSLQCFKRNKWSGEMNDWTCLYLKIS